MVSKGQMQCDKRKDREQDEREGKERKNMRKKNWKKTKNWNDEKDKEEE